MNTAVLSVRDLSKTYVQRSGLFGAVKETRAVRNVSFDVGRGEILGLVGESGSGKTTVGRMAMRLLDATSGQVVLSGTDITTYSQARLRAVRRKMQLIFQDPSASLNPRQTIHRILRTPLALRGIDSDQDILETLALVGMSPDILNRTPAMFSGGQRQRLSIARALLMQPELLVADEAVSALDVCVQAQVVNLFVDLRDRLGLSILFIGHDLAVVGVVSDRVGVMYRGVLVEVARTADLFRRPRHPYTAQLLAAAPRHGAPLPPDPAHSQFSQASGGCVFAPLCSHMTFECLSRQPDLSEVGPAHQSACLRTELQLSGV